MNDDLQSQLDYSFLLFNAGLPEGLEGMYKMYGSNLKFYIAERTGSCVHAQEVSKFILRSAQNRRKSLQGLTGFRAYADKMAKRTVLIYLYHAIRMRLHFHPVLPKEFGEFESMFTDLVHQAAKDVVPHHAAAFSLAIRHQSDRQIADKLGITLDEVAVSKRKASEKVWDYFEQYYFPHLSIPLQRHEPTEFVPSKSKFLCNPPSGKG